MSDDLKIAAEAVYVIGDQVVEAGVRVMRKDGLDFEPDKAEHPALHEMWELDRGCTYSVWVQGVGGYEYVEGSAVNWFDTDPPVDADYFSKLCWDGYVVVSETAEWRIETANN